MSTLFRNANLLTGGQFTSGCLLVGNQGDIEFVGPESGLHGSVNQVVDLLGRSATPGLIDIHVHGGYGVRFGMSDAVEEDIEKYRRWVVRNGVTGFLCSIMAPTSDRLLELLTRLRAVPTQGSGADFLGVHLEGPFLNPEKKGAIDPAYLRKPDLDEGQKLLDAGGDLIRQITIAPELEGAMELADLFSAAGVTVALGHSNAEYETACSAYRGSFTHTTHTFNAQTGFGHRKPGVVGAILNDQRATGELIADLVHVHPGAIRLLFNCLGSERIALITDAMEATGLPDGQYTLSGRERIVAGGKSVLPDGTLAGSTATLDQCVRNMVQRLDIPFAESVKMASAVPARVIHANAQVGDLEAGRAANLVVWDSELHVCQTYVRGCLVYER